MKQAELYPLKFEPIYQYRIWGGRRLGDLDAIGDIRGHRAGRDRVDPDSGCECQRCRARRGAAGVEQKGDDVRIRFIGKASGRSERHLTLDGIEQILGSLATEARQESLPCQGYGLARAGKVVSVAALAIGDIASAARLHLGGIKWTSGPILRIGADRPQREGGSRCQCCGVNCRLFQEERHAIVTRLAIKSYEDPVTDACCRVRHSWACHIAAKTLDPVAEHPGPESHGQRVSSPTNCLQEPGLQRC